jgi:hypothetical protein
LPLLLLSLPGVLHGSGTGSEQELQAATVASWASLSLSTMSFNPGIHLYSLSSRVRPGRGWEEEQVRKVTCR